MGALLIVGLGNPGGQYALNRHNVGFRILDRIVETRGFTSYRVKDQGMVAEGKIGGHKIYALKPMNYMNRSGQAVRSLAAFYKIPVEDIIVLHDDIDLDPGKIKIKQGGGHGGHNGLRDIDAHMGKDYWRVRFGVGHPGHRDLVSGYVLKNFSKDEEKEIPFLIDDIAHAIEHVVAKNPEEFLKALQ